MHSLFSKTALFIAVVSPLCFAEMGPPANIPLDDSGSPRLEIRNYRFQSHRGQGFERLVLEFTRKDTNLKVQPQVKVSPAGNDWDVAVDHAVLMGAIPESLINDAFSGKSRYLGNLSVNADNAAAGFSLRTALKNPKAKMKAFWLANPPRLVIDVRVGKEVANDEAVSSKQTSLTVARKRPLSSAFEKFICFPAAAKVGMNVVFQMNQRKTEELKNVHVNLQGTSVQEEAPPPADAIACYPRDAQVVAQLGFEMTNAPSDESTASNEPAPVQTGVGTNPALMGNASQASAQAAGTTVDESDMTLNPEPEAAHGNTPRMPGSAPAHSKTAAPMLPPPPAAFAPAAAPDNQKAPILSSPASLLPPLK